MGLSKSQKRMVHFEVDQIELTESLKKMGAKLKELTDDTLCRLGVSVARELAILTEPMGSGSKADLRTSTDKGVDRWSVSLKDKGLYNVFRKSMWGKIDSEQYERLKESNFIAEDSPATLDRFMRNARRGVYKRATSDQRQFVTQTTAKKTKATRYRHLAGAGKGSWAAAGNALAPQAPTSNAVKGITRGKVSAQVLKFSHLGSAKLVRKAGALNLSRSHVQLTSHCHYIASVTKSWVYDEAVARSKKNTLAWMKRVWRAREKNA